MGKPWNRSSPFTSDPVNPMGRLRILCTRRWSRNGDRHRTAASVSVPGTEIDPDRLPNQGIDSRSRC